MKSGIYVVELLNKEPIFSCSHDKRKGKQGTPLTKGHIKFGKAVDLDRRQKNYLKTFGDGNFNFQVVHITSQIDEIEKRIMKEVDEYRVRGTFGRKLEWLEGININNLIKVIDAVVSE